MAEKVGEANAGPSATALAMAESLLEETRVRHGFQCWPGTEYVAALIDEAVGKERERCAVIARDEYANAAAQRKANRGVDGQDSTYTQGVEAAADRIETKIRFPTADRPERGG